MRRLSFLSIFGIVQIHQQKYTQLYRYAQLENMLNFYEVHNTLCAGGIGINLLLQKLPVEHWWNSTRVEFILSADLNLDFTNERQTDKRRMQTLFQTHP